MLVQYPEIIWKATLIFVNSRRVVCMVLVELRSLQNVRFQFEPFLVVAETTLCHTYLGQD